MRTRLIAAVSALALLAVACGDSGDAEPEEPETPTEEPSEEPAEEPDTEEPDTEEPAEEPEAAASDWPTEDITAIVTFGPGGGNDLLIRSLAPLLSEELGVQVAVENVEGGSGVIGLTEAYSREADGYTLVSYSPPGEYLSELQGQLSGFGTEDFTMLGAVNVDPGAFAVPLDSPYESMEDLVAALEAGESLTAATSGLTSNNAVGAIDFMTQTGLEFELIPYDSGAELTASVIGGTADFGIRAGGFYDLHEEELRILAFTAPERIEEFPDIPTVEEVTGEPVYFSSLRGLAVRSDTPEDVITRLQEAFEAAATDPELSENLIDEIGFRWQYLPPEEAQATAEEMMASVDEAAEEIGIGG